MRTRRKHNSTPVKHGDWWTIRVRKDSPSNEQQTRIDTRVKLAPVIGVDGKPTPLRTVKQLAVEYLHKLNEGLEATSEELAVYRADPPTTPHADFVVCLECGQKRASIATTHLRKHGLTWVTYQAKWPNAPMYCEASRHARNRASLKFQKKYYAANSEEILRAKRTPAYRAKANPAARKRRAANLAAHRKYDRAWRAKKKIPKASEEELDRFLKSPDTCDYVVCLEPGCRAKLSDIGGIHIQKIHGLTIEHYAERYPGAPLRALTVKPKASKKPRGRKTAEEKGVEKINAVIGKIVSEQTKVFEDVLALPRAQWSRNGFSKQIQEAAHAALTSRGAAKDRPRIAARYMVGANPKLFGFKAAQFEYDTVAKYDRQYLSSLRKSLARPGQDKN